MTEYEPLDSYTVASFCAEGAKLHIAFDDLDRSVTLDMKSEAQMDVALRVLADPNFWANFLDSFSKAINNHVESK